MNSGDHNTQLENFVNITVLRIILDKQLPVSLKVVSASGSRSGPSSKYAIKRLIITIIAFLAMQVNQIVFSAIFRTMGDRRAQYD